MEPLRASLAVCLFAVLVFVGSVTLTASVQSDADTLHSRQKRNIFQMCHIMSLYTGRGCIQYNNYGCFCGHGNSGNNPVDAVDRCCQDHDRCYGRTGCWLTGVFVRYNYKCRYGYCTCRDNRWYSPCEFNTCECDLQLARCLEWTYYNSSYSDYDRALCN